MVEVGWVGWRVRWPVRCRKWENCVLVTVRNRDGKEEVIERLRDSDSVVVVKVTWWICNW